MVREIAKYQLNVEGITCTCQCDGVYWRRGWHEYDGLWRLLARGFTRGLHTVIDSGSAETGRAEKSAQRERGIQRNPRTDKEGNAAHCGLCVPYFPLNMAASTEPLCCVSALRETDTVPFPPMLRSTTSRTLTYRRITQTSTNPDIVLSISFSVSLSYILSAEHGGQHRAVVLSQCAARYRHGPLPANTQVHNIPHTGVVARDEADLQLELLPASMRV